MRAVIQRVTQASVTVGEEIVGKIGKGICVLVGLHKDDADNDIEYMVRKVLNTRIFDGENDKKWNKSVKDLNLEILCVSQFTLCAVLKGNKPDFHNSMNPNDASINYQRFLDLLKKEYSADKIQDGRFAAMMSVSITNDGPVTINIDSRSRD